MLALQELATAILKALCLGTFCNETRTKDEIEQEFEDSVKNLQSTPAFLKLPPHEQSNKITHLLIRKNFRLGKLENPLSEKESTMFVAFSKVIRKRTNELLLELDLENKP